MIIGIDGYEANVSHRVGIGQYAYELLVHLYALLGTQKNHEAEVLVYLPSAPRVDMPAETTWWHYRVVSPAKLWTFIGLPLALKREEPAPDVIFSPTHYIPRFTTIPRIMSIMDLSYLHFPSFFKAKDLYQLQHWTRYSASHASRVFTISEFSKNAIINTYHVPEKNVIVTYPGFRMPEQNTTTPSLDHIRRKYAVSSNFILSVGTLQPRKNFVRLIESFALFLKTNKQKFSDLQLVIIGKKGWLYEDILAAPKKFGVANQVKFLDFVPDEDLPTFYKHAICFGLPSLYEGFGLPVLEAMAYACPVVVSNVSSLPEIAGRAGIYVDPNSVESIAKGLLAAVRERNLMQGRQRVTKGLAQVKLFTWEKAAKQTLDILMEVGGQAI